MSDEIISAPEADLTNWRSAPHSRWAFHHVDQIVPTASIANDPQHVRALAKRDVRFDEKMYSLPGGGGIDLDSFLVATATDALIVLKDGALAFETYANGMAAADRHILMSATKAIMGLLAGALHDRGEIDVASPVVQFLPELRDTLYADATLRDLLDMRVAAVLDQEQQRAYENATNWGPVEADHIKRGFAGFFASLRSPPAATAVPFKYVSANTDLLGLALAAATGRTVPALLEALLWKPMGAEYPAYMTLDDDGAARTTGGLCATARDFARLGQLIIDGGRVDGAELVSSKWVEDIAAEGDRDAWRTGEWGQAFAPISPDMAYRSGWYAIDGPAPLLFAMGIHGQNLFVDRSNKIVVAKLSSQAQPIDFNAIGLTHMVIPQIIGRVRGR